MNEISTTTFLFLTAVSLLFLAAVIFLENKIYSLISGLIALTGFYSLAQMTISGKVGIFYVSGTTLSFQAMQSTTMYYYYYMVAFVSGFLTLYVAYEIVMEFFKEKNTSAFDNKKSAFNKE